MDNPHPYGLWLEPVLERHLGQVTAPDELWDRVRHPRPIREAASVRDRLPRRLMLVAAAVMVAAAVWGFLPQRTVMEFHSDAAAEIRAWVKVRTGLDIPLPARPSPEVQLTGVCQMRRGAPAVEVAYRVSGHKAALRVTKASAELAGDGKHRFLKCESADGTRVSSWTMRGQLYTLAYAVPSAAGGDGRDECLLCHSGSEQLTLSN